MKTNAKYEAVLHFVKHNYNYLYKEIQIDIWILCKKNNSAFC